MREITLHRDALYEAVWSEPATKVAAKYGMSSVALAKICRKLHVPAPPRGYWARKAAGARDRRPALPKLKEGEPDRHVVSVRPHLIAAMEPSSPVAAAVQQVRQAARIVVPDVVDELHPLVRSATRLLAQRKLDHDVWVDHRCIDIRVSVDMVGRSFRVMHALVCALEARGVGVEVTEPSQRTGRHHGWDGRSDVEKIPSRTIATVDGEAIAFQLSEGWRTPPIDRPRLPPRQDHSAEAILARIRTTYPPVKPVPNGRLSLSIMDDTFGLGFRRSWNDGAHQRVETLLNGFIAGLYIAADAIRRDREAREQRERERREQERRRAEAAARQKRHEQLVKDLQGRLRDWRLARETHELADAVEAAHAGISDNDRSIQATRDWIAWVRRWADRVEHRAVSTVVEAWIPEQQG